MGAKQGLENVLHATRRADDRRERVRFLLMGDGGRRRALEAAAAGLERVSFVDPLPDCEFEDALCDAVAAVGSDRAWARELGARGRAYADRHLTAGAAARAYLEWVETLADSR